MTSILVCRSTLLNSSNRSNLHTVYCTVNGAYLVPNHGSLNLLLIRIHFLRIWIQLFFSMRIRIQIHSPGYNPSYWEARACASLEFESHKLLHPIRLYSPGGGRVHCLLL